MMTKGQHDSRTKVFSKQKGRNIEKHSNMKDGQPRSWSNSLQIYPSKGHPITHSETRGSCIWLAYPISQEALHAVNHIGLEWMGP